ncbi:hypothetical protein SIN8267_01091 [Sinobacterium norvegicum]|uniref:DUF393 domain-containing protein n=1 Tax=Sinobacterium norvegicum TaxID=1641715 RepID=A0ABM9ACS0_9GAMM|nr:DUF393 domain-containing protein [Sinobacterium norvegicum]CAH0990990.1 hypothetical protein SIN8267_01091 [Sinobacterium norvegicum]
MSEPTANLYYDGSCPMCSAEMKHLAKHKTDQLCLLDIHQAELPPGKTTEDLLTVLHYKAPDGRWLTGLDATLAVWSNTLLGKALTVLRWPVIKPVADSAYNLWARKRYARLYGKAHD